MSIDKIQTVNLRSYQYEQANKKHRKKIAETQGTCDIILNV